MNEVEKKSLIEQIMKIEDDAILSQIKAMVEVGKKDYWNNLPAHVKESIEIGIQESKQGLGRPHEEVMKELRSKYKG